MSTRVMPGVFDWTGSEVNGLSIGQMVRRSPEPVYQATCLRCSAQGHATQSQLRNGTARCLASICGKPEKRRDTLAEQRREAAARAEAQRLAELETSEARMRAETEGYELPSNDRPSAEHVVLTERERIAVRERREAEEAEQRAADAPRLEAERRAAEEQAEREQREQQQREKRTAYWRDVVLNDRDMKLYVSPEMRNASMPAAQVEANNLSSVHKFVADTPEYSEYRTPSNASATVEYLKRNGVHIFDVPTLKAAFVRLRDLGALSKRPTPEPEKFTATPTRVNLGAERPSQPTSPQTFTGRDPLTGNVRTYTQTEVNRMSADEYRRAFPVITSVGGLFSAIADAR